MAKRRSFDPNIVPLLLVILIPVAVVLYALFGQSASSATPATAASVQTATQASAALPQAVITLNDPSSLPSSVSAGQLVPFSFTVENPSGTDATYQYKVVVQWSTGENDVVDENTLALPAGTAKTIDEQLKFEIATETAAVSFELPQTNQSVQFELPRSQ